jgi:hypothetical protein
MFAARNKKHLAAATWSFVVLATVQAVQLDIAASPGKLNLCYKVHESISVLPTMCGPDSRCPILSRPRLTQPKWQSAVLALSNKRFA